MKKIFLSIIMMTLMATASAQFAVSAHLGGSYFSGGSTYDAMHHAISPTLTDSSYAVDMDPYNFDTPLSLTGGLKFGYQFGRIQVGISGSFSWNKVRGDFSPAQYNANNPNLSPDDMLNLNWKYDDYQGYFTQQQTSFSIAPYLRFEAIQIGDVAFFLELDGFFSKYNKPQRFEYLDFYHAEMHHTIDHDSTVNRTNTELGARLTPGLSWQLSEHCYIDLYLDVLSFAFIHDVENSVIIKDEWDNVTSPAVLSRHTVYTITTTKNVLGFEATGIAPIGNINRNWVRVGFNYTF